jgi:DNA invertase Pin-like site-specific DNA recombinase
MANQLSDPVNYSELRYVLYARKSTEDEGSQVRSLGDQIIECKKLAERNGYNICKVVEEAKSAKKPHNRPRFRQLLEDVKSGKYDGIISWHPDRLSRNMLESGEIIDMLDNGELKDLRFVSHQFSNDANGKMLLGMLFVFSKQYSEDLSEKVKRGNRHNLDEGKSAGTPKWGYNRNQETGLYEPDGNFNLIRKGWDMRLEGKTYDEILKYWRAHDLHREKKITRKNKH